ncbi:MAG: hypothetical protein ACYSUV_14210, partial [Planctomycetota bacterium]
SPEPAKLLLKYGKLARLSCNSRILPKVRKTLSRPYTLFKSEFQREIDNYFKAKTERTSESDRWPSEMPPDNARQLWQAMC